MTIKNTKLGGTDFSTPSDRVKPTDLNDTFDAVADKLRSISQIYTGSGFDVSRGPSEASGTTSADHELDAIVAADVEDKKYVRITLLLKPDVQCSGGNTGSVKLKLQSKEIAGAYGDLFGYMDIVNHPSVGTGNHDHTTTFTWIHTLTAGEIAAGVQFKVLTQAAINNNGVSDWAILSNAQTVVEVIGE